MFVAVSAATIVPTMFIGYFGQTNYTALLVGGFFLGIAGTSFAVGVPFVNAWFPPERRGLAIGIFGAGMGGTAISALTTVKLYTNFGDHAPFLAASAAPGRVRHRRVVRHGGRSGTRDSDGLLGGASGGERQVADHVAGQCPVRRGIRRIRRVLGLPALLPQDGL